MTFAITIGKYAGFWVNFGYMKRICLGWIAIDFYPFEIDEVMNDAVMYKMRADELEKEIEQYNKE